MAFPFPTVTSQAVTTNANSPGNFSMPTLVVGQLLVAVTGSPTVASTPSGWTSVGAASFGTTTKLGVFAKVCAGGDTLAVATTLGVGGFITAVSNWSGVIADLVLATVSGSLDPPSVSMGAANNYLWMTGAFNFTNLITGAPTNYGHFATTTYSSTTTTDNNQKMAYADRSLNATSEDPGVFAGTSNFSGAWTLGIKPAASARAMVYGNVPVMRAATR